MAITTVDPSIPQPASGLATLVPGELHAIVGRHERDLAHRPAGRPCTACMLFERAGSAASVVAIDGHLYFPAVEWEPSGRHAHPTHLPSSESRTRADLATVRALIEEVRATDPAAQQALELENVGARLDRVDAADPLTDRTAIADAAALMLRIVVGGADG